MITNGLKKVSTFHGFLVVNLCFHKGFSVIKPVGIRNIISLSIRLNRTPGFLVDKLIRQFLENQIKAFVFQNNCQRLIFNDINGLRLFFSPALPSMSQVEDSRKTSCSSFHSSRLYLGVNRQSQCESTDITKISSGSKSKYLQVAKRD